MNRRLGGRAEAQLYPAACSFSLWRWADDGEVMATEEGQTIAFRQEVEEVLERLAPDGLPPFDAVALYLIACSPAWSPTMKRRVEDRVGQRIRGRDRARMLEPVLAGLDRIHDAAAEQPSTPGAKAELAAMVFEGCPHRAAGASGDGTRGGQDALVGSRLCLESLSLGLESFSRERLDLWRATGLREPPQPASVDGLTTPDAVRALLELLTEDPEHRQVARLARDLLAAVHVPRVLSVRQELPVGGVADIATRGPLDRLLLSELAHDHDVLAARIASGEALYLRQEAPPGQPPGSRRIFIDTGIRLWGRPRVFAAAVALALAASADRRTMVTAHVPGPEGAVIPIDLGTRDGLLQLLEELSSAPHPGRSLPAFGRTMASLRGGDEPQPILVTHGEVLRDPNFAADLKSLPGAETLVATVDGDGNFALEVVSRRGRRHLTSAQLSLADILPSTAPAIPRAGGSDLPAILYRDPFPLLLPYRVDLARCRHSSQHGVVACANDGRLLHWRPGRHEGARQLSTRTGWGRVHWMHLDAGGVAGALRSGAGHDRLRLTRADLRTGEVTHAELTVPARDRMSVFVRGETLHIVTDGMVRAFDRDTGEELCPPASGGGRHLGAGLFLGRSPRPEVSTVRFDGTRIQGPIPVEHIPHHLRGSLRGQPWVRGGDGELLALLDHPPRIVRLASEPAILELPLASGVQLLATSQDGHRLVVRGFADGLATQACVDLTTRSVLARDIDHRTDRWLEPRVHARTAPGGSLRNRFRAVFVDRRGQLGLVSRKGHSLHLVLDSEADRLLLVQRSPEEYRDARLYPFSAARSRMAGGYRMHGAQLPKGSHAFLDSRGLLHLRSGDPGLPEVALVLTAHELAGWSSEGRVCGPAFYIGETPPDRTCQRVAAGLFYIGLRHFLAGLE